MNFGKLGGILKKIGLPILGAAIPGGGIAVDLVKNAIGIEHDASEDQMIAAVEANPEAVLKLKAQEQEHERALIDLSIKREAQELADRQGARDRDVEVRKISGDNRRADILAYLAVIQVLLLGSFLVYLALTGGEVPVPIIALLSTLLGGVLGYQGAVYSFEFGSSKGSREKDAVIARKDTGQ